MSKQDYNIDFSIIWKKIHAELSPEEELFFTHWLDADSSNKAFFNKVLYYYETGWVKDRKDLNIVKSWEKVDLRLKSPQKDGFPKWLKLMGSAAAVIVIILSVYLVFGISKNDSSVQDITQITILPGNSRAQLILDDGKTLDLDEGKDFEEKVDGAEILNQGKRVIYKHIPAKTKDLKYNTLVIPRGAEYFVILSDGSKVWLNSESSLRYPVNFMGNERKVTLTGEGYFEVTKDASKPFRVISGGQVVEVLGTQFNISSYTEDAQISTTLVEGKVKVYTTNKPQLNEYLIPGLQATMNKKSGNISIHKVDVNQYVAWKNGRFVFENQTLGDIMRTLSRWYDVDFVFKDVAKQNIRFTGELKRYDNLEKMLRLIENTQEIKIEKVNNEIVIK